MSKTLILFIFMITIFFTACGGGSSSSDGGTTPSASTSVSMVPNQTYTMSTGQSIVKESEPTELVLETNVNTGETEATLVNGAASIVTN